ncbi:hypothetical protein DL95DRAFT_461635 [Leptodontidium sp. 2 PMI_412]|nr:hypothetical protein BKA61DRAFT_712259 [Leptodontidium sp. MPI-SDFR-AT-0119]KAH9214796.1 hypothetical protein DL95DRAFT_461635 [Leptodontidium sp. 2 PMI_412]
MKFQLALVALLPLVYSLPAAEPAPEAAVSDASPAALFKRACSYNNDCYSETGISAVRLLKTFAPFASSLAPESRRLTHKRVNGKSSGDTCCSYGPSSSCAAKWPSLNGNVLYNCKNTDKGY